MSRRSAKTGFSLVEILVAMAVLAIMSIIFAEIVSMTDSTIRLSNQSVAASGQAYLSFDRLRADLAAAVKRSDVDFIAQNPSTVVGGGNALLFLADVTSAGDLGTGGVNRNLSVIAYQVADSSDNGGRPCLLRAGKPIAWSTTGFMGLQNGLPMSLTSASFPAALIPSTSASPSDFDVLAPGVIRMAIGFQLYPDNLPVTLNDGSVPSPATGQGQVVYSAPVRSVTPTGGGNAVNYIDWSRIAAVVVGVVTLDTNNLSHTSAAQVTALAQAFPLPTSGTLPLKSWVPVADGLSTAGPAGVPLPVRQAVRVFQQVFPVTPYGTTGPS